MLPPSHSLPGCAGKYWLWQRSRMGGLSGADSRRARKDGPSEMLRGKVGPAFLQEGAAAAAAAAAAPGGLAGGVGCGGRLRGGCEALAGGLGRGAGRAGWPASVIWCMQLTWLSDDARRVGCVPDVEEGRVSCGCVAGVRADSSRRCTAEPGMLVELSWLAAVELGPQVWMAPPVDLKPAWFALGLAGGGLSGRAGAMPLAATWMTPFHGPTLGSSSRCARGEASGRRMASSVTSGRTAAGGGWVGGCKGG